MAPIFGKHCHFTTLPVGFYKRLSEQTESEIRVYLCLCYHGQVHSSPLIAALSLADIQTELNISDESVRKALRGLERKFFIQQQRVAGKWIFTLLHPDTKLPLPSRHDRGFNIAPEKPAAESTESEDGIPGKAGAPLPPTGLSQADVQTYFWHRFPGAKFAEGSLFKNHIALC